MCVPYKKTPTPLEDMKLNTHDYASISCILSFIRPKEPLIITFNDLGGLALNKDKDYYNFRLVNNAFNSVWKAVNDDQKLFDKTPQYTEDELLKMSDNRLLICIFKQIETYDNVDLWSEFVKRIASADETNIFVTNGPRILFEVSKYLSKFNANGYYYLMKACNKLFGNIDVPYPLDKFIIDGYLKKEVLMMQTHKDALYYSKLLEISITQAIVECNYPLISAYMLVIKRFMYEVGSVSVYKVFCYLIDCGAVEIIFDMPTTNVMILAMILTVGGKRRQRFMTAFSKFVLSDKVSPYWKCVHDVCFAYNMIISYHKIPNLREDEEFVRMFRLTSLIVYKYSIDMEIRRLIIKTLIPNECYWPDIGKMFCHSSKNRKEIINEYFTPELVKHFLDEGLMEQRLFNGCEFIINAHLCAITKKNIYTVSWKQLKRNAEE